MCIILPTRENDVTYRLSKCMDIQRGCILYLTGLVMNTNAQKFWKFMAKT